MKEATLTPPDTRRCQAEKPNGATFMTCGGRPEMVRCMEKPTMIVTEILPPKGSNQCGAMSLCDACKVVFDRQMGTTNFVVTKL